MIYSLLCFLAGFYLILFYNVHYTILFLSLEVTLLGVFVYLALGSFLSLGMIGSILFLLVMVCVGGFSVSFLVSLSRAEGGDFWFSGYIF